MEVKATMKTMTTTKKMRTLPIPESTSQEHKEVVDRDKGSTRVKEKTVEANRSLFHEVLTMMR